jgi:hypothetical protein
MTTLKSNSKQKVNRKKLVDLFWHPHIALNPRRQKTEGKSKHTHGYKVRKS